MFRGLKHSMVRSVIIARVHDGLPLAAGMDDDNLERDFPEYHRRSKAVIHSLATQAGPMASIDAGTYTF